MPAALRASIPAWIERYPGRAFAAFAASHAAVWTLLPTLLYPNLPLDLIEALMYGREWQLGYDKLPPLPWWLVKIAHQAVGHDFAYYLLAEIVVIAALALVFAASRPLTGGVGALIAVLILDGLHYVNFTAVKFNHDVVQLPFWALAGFALHRGLRGGKIADWLLLGLAVGMALWAKYFVVVLVAPMVVFVLVDRRARQALKTPGPWIAVATALVVAAPHLVWLVKSDFLPFAYAEHRAMPSRGWYDHLWHPLRFAVGQLFFLLPALAIAAPLFIPRRGANEREAKPSADAFDYRIVTWLAFGPLATVLLMAAVSGRGTIAMWGYPIWLFLGTWMVLTARPALEGWRLRRMLTTWAIVFSCLALAFVVTYDLRPRFGHRYIAVFFPGERLGAEIGERFRAATGEPLHYVIGSMWLGGNIAHYAPSHPRVLVDGKPRRAPWIDLADLRRKGAAVVWTGSDPQKLPAGYRAIAPQAAVQPPLHLPNRFGNRAATFGWAVVRPQE